MLTALTATEVKSEFKRRQCPALSGPRGENVPNEAAASENLLIKQSAEQQGTEAQD